MGGIDVGKCGIHQVPAGECFHLHYPDAHRKEDGIALLAKYNLSTMEVWMLDFFKDGVAHRLGDAIAREDREHAARLFTLMKTIKDELSTR